MKAMVIERIAPLSENDRPFRMVDLPDPEPGKGELLLRVRCCGVCHTEMDEVEGRTPPAFLPMVPGHQVVGVVEAFGDGVEGVLPGSRRGVAWIYSACGACRWCRRGEENLCPSFRATGRDAFGGYAELMVVPAAFTYPIPGRFSDAEAAPLLCAGAVGYRSLMLAGLEDGRPLGLAGFGASGHLVLKTARFLYPRSPLFVFARSPIEREFALQLGASWAGGTTDAAPEPCRAIIDTTPAWLPVKSALEQLEPGGRLVINAIRKGAGDEAVLSSIEYERHLWMEKGVKSVANVTRADVSSFLRIADSMGIEPEVELFGFDDANSALLSLRGKGIRGAKVLAL